MFEEGGALAEAKSKVRKFDVTFSTRKGFAGTALLCFRTGSAETKSRRTVKTNPSRTETILQKCAT